MEALKTVSTFATPSLNKAHFSKPIISLSFNHLKPILTQFPKSKFTKFTAISSSVSTEEETETLDDQNDKFDWFSHWYAVMPVCDLDKRAPLGKKVMGVDVVVWWDKNDNAWKVFDDRCPHRLAPLSEGRIDQRGRLQCVYHGWCFGGSGDCKFIPQAPTDSPPVHSFPKACVSVYPSTVQNGIVWFWPNTDPQYKDILTKKKPPYIPELDDPSFIFQMFHRDIPYGYEVLIENLMDPSHVAYAHRGIISPLGPETSVKRDREGGSPIDINIQKMDKNGFTTFEQPHRVWNFISPCVFQDIITTRESPDNTQGNQAQKPPQKGLVVFFCVPVSPGNSRVIFGYPRNFRLQIDLYPRWMHHIIQNLVIDSDLYLLRIQEENIMEAGSSKWQKVCFVPTKADTNVIVFRKWLKIYSGGQIDWVTKFDGSVSDTLPREQFMDRYWSHVVNCSSCSGAYKGFNALKISLQVFSVASVAIMAATKQEMMSVATRNTLGVSAILCFVVSKWLSRFIYKNFHFHDYDHAFK